MHRPEITYDPTMPDEIRKAVSPLVEKWAWLAPSWVRSLCVSNDAAGEHIARVESQVRYRRASVFVSPHWLEEGDEEREHYLVHELCHLFQSPLVDWVSRVIDRLADEGSQLAQELHDRLAEHCEGTTTDLARALLEKSPKALGADWMTSQELEERLSRLRAQGATFSQPAGVTFTEPEGFSVPAGEQPNGVEL